VLTIADVNADPRDTTMTVRVLIVDDVADIRKLIRMTLERCGPFAVVGEAGDGELAIHEAARLQPDVVLLDLSMPVMDGLEALPAIVAASPNSKVLVLSGFTASEMSDEAMRLGAAGYMEKGGIVAKLGPRLRELVPHAAPARNGHAAVTEPAETELFALLIRDLSRPLTVLHALASRLLRAEELPPDAARSALDANAREARNLEMILRTFSDTAKVEFGGLDLALVPTNLPQLVRELILELTDITAVHPINVEMEERVVINLDPMRIRQVLMTLLSNAAKFSPADAPIEVSSLTTDDGYEVRVRDHGPGIPEVHRHRLFRKFGRVNPDAAGTGLALYISREIARAHGGEVFLASCDETGCVFALRLRHLS
jgi:signal transduction histidine kinase